MKVYLKSVFYEYRISAKYDSHSIFYLLQNNTKFTCINFKNIYSGLQVLFTFDLFQKKVNASLYHTSKRKPGYFYFYHLRKCSMYYLVQSNAVLQLLGRSFSSWYLKSAPTRTTIFRWVQTLTI